MERNKRAIDIAGMNEKSSLSMKLLCAGMSRIEKWKNLTAVFYLKTKSIGILHFLNPDFSGLKIL